MTTILTFILSNLKTIGAAVWKWYSGETPIGRRDTWIILLILMIPGAYWIGNNRLMILAPVGPVQTSPVTVAGHPVTVIQFRDHIEYIPKGGGPVSIIDLWPEDLVTTDTNGLQKVSRFGFCFKPGIGYGTDFYGFGPAASIRFAHWNRFGLSASILRTNHAISFGPGIDVRFQWLMNVRLGLSYGIRGTALFNTDTVDLR